MHNNDNRLSVEGPRQSGRTLVGIDAAITARHHVAVRSDGAETTKRFSVEPTLAGLRTLTDRLVGYDNIDAVVEPTSMTWLALTIAVEKAGGTMHRGPVTDVKDGADMTLPESSSGRLRQQSLRPAVEVQAVVVCGPGALVAAVVGRRAPGRR